MELRLSHFLKFIRKTEITGYYMIKKRIIASVIPYVLLDTVC